MLIIKVEKLIEKSLNCFIRGKINPTVKRSKANAIAAKGIPVFCMPTVVVVVLLLVTHAPKLDHCVPAPKFDHRVPAPKLDHCVPAPKFDH
ncbi:MAG: hypothetical protein A4E27_00056 [Methanobacterium sp. PtaU1.Bin242]|nr:MAG: hypothetical protein A4E27_00056 [Methanobacterium sp. PtaU1.Bin242]